MRAETSEGTLPQGMRSARLPEPVSIVIFGATGDLTARKLVPALFSLAVEGQLPSAYSVVGFARRDWGHGGFRQRMREGVTQHGRIMPERYPDAWDSFARNLHYVQGAFNEPERFAELDRFLSELARERGGADNRLYYLAAPPEWYDDIVLHLGQAGMVQDSAAGWRRIVIEKPFGSDLASAEHLNEMVHGVFRERQVFRIDHYLGKETVQNILVLRFANAIFEPVWNRRYVDHVQISVIEPGGIEGRAGFYDSAGVVRDIFQNHLLQVMTLVAMEPPAAFEAGTIRDEKVKVLRAVRPINGADVATSTVRGQYTRGKIDGQAVPGYLEIEGVAPGSTTATYAAIRLYIDNWRWQGVPFYLRSGKRLPKRVTDVSIHFKQPPHLLFGAEAGSEAGANVLGLRIQPDEGISLRFEAKVPGQGVVHRPVTMDFCYETLFGIAAPPDAYERLLLDALLGDATLFARSDEIEWAWRLVDPILQGWESEHAPALELYEAGTWGPGCADALLGQDGRRWSEL